MREVLRRRDEGDAEAVLAFEVHQHRLVTQVGAMVAALQGLDVLVLTGGVGERLRPVGEDLCARLRWLGVLTDHRDGTGQDRGLGVRELTTDGARVRTLVVHAREDLQMVAEARAVLGAA
jgi:acetate kinase